MTSAIRWGRSGVCLSRVVVFKARGGAWRRVRERPATSGDRPPTNVIVSTCRFQICKNIYFWIYRKTPKLDRMPDFFIKPKKIFSDSYALNSNPWLALIPTVGYDLNNLDHHVKTQSIVLMEKNCKLHT